MQLQGLMFMLFILLILPVLALSTNHLLFFAVVALIVIISSIRSIHSCFSGADYGEEEDSEEAEEDFEDLLNLDMKKFGAGIYVVKYLFLILFYIYCSIYIKSILLKADAALLILIQVHHIKNISMKGSTNKEIKPFDRSIALVSAILSLVLVIFTSFNIIFGLDF